MTQPPTSAADPFPPAHGDVPLVPPRPPAPAAPAPQPLPAYAQHTPPGYAQHTPPRYAQQPPPGYAQQPPPGYAQQTPAGYVQQPPPGYAQQPPPGYGQASTRPSAYDQPQLSPAGGPGAPYAAPYAQAQFPAYGNALNTPLAPRKKTLGLVALLIAAVSMFVSTVIAALFMGPVAKRLTAYVAEKGKINLADIDSIDLGFFRSVRDSVLWVEVSFWIAVVGGLTALVLGIIAAAQRRGRGLGVAAIVLGVSAIAAWIGVVLFITSQAIGS